MLFWLAAAKIKFPMHIENLQKAVFMLPSFESSLIQNSELVLCGLSMVPISFTDLVGAAAAAGFDAVSVGAAVYRRARRDGLSMAEMRRILDDAGVWVSEVEGVGDWLTGAEDKDDRRRPSVSDDELIDLAVALGARRLLVVHFGSEVPAADAAGPFAALCDRMAPAGISVVLEFVAFATINRLGYATEVVEQAGRPNGGMMFDTWHYRRGRPDPDGLAGLPPDRVLGVQLADADAEVRGPLEEDILHRRLPGRGQLDLASLVAHLDRQGVRAPVGVEVWDQELLVAGPQAAAAELARSVRDFLAGLA